MRSGIAVASARCISVSEPLLSVSGLDSYYGESQVLFDVSCDIDEQEVVGVFGRNGMGKTTFLRSIINQVTHTGTIRFDGQDITDLPSHAVIREGIAYVPEDRAIYAELTAQENIDLAAPRQVDRAEVDRRLEGILDLFPNLRDRLSQPGGTLSGGEQQMLAIARGLITEPTLLLLDEPTEGLAPVIIDDLMDTLDVIAAEDRTIVIVEQNINRTLSVVDRGYFIENGRFVAEGTAEELGDASLQREHLTV